MLHRKLSLFLLAGLFSVSISSASVESGDVAIIRNDFSKNFIEEELFPRVKQLYADLLNLIASHETPLETLFAKFWKPDIRLPRYRLPSNRVLKEQDSKSEVETPVLTEEESAPLTVKKDKISAIVVTETHGSSNGAENSTVRVVTDHPDQAEALLNSVLDTKKGNLVSNLSKANAKSTSTKKSKSTSSSPGKNSSITASTSNQTKSLSTGVTGPTGQTQTATQPVSGVLQSQPKTGTVASAPQEASVNTANMLPTLGQSVEQKIKDFKLNLGESLAKTENANSSANELAARSATRSESGTQEQDLSEQERERLGGNPEMAFSQSNNLAEQEPLSVVPRLASAHTPILPAPLLQEVETELSAPAVTPSTVTAPTQATTSTHAPARAVSIATHTPASKKPSEKKPLPQKVDQLLTNVAACVADSCVPGAGAVVHMARKLASSTMSETPTFLESSLNLRKLGSRPSIKNLICQQSPAELGRLQSDGYIATLGRAVQCLSEVSSGFQAAYGSLGAGLFVISETLAQENLRAAELNEEVNQLLRSHDRLTRGLEAGTALKKKSSTREASLHPITNFMHAARNTLSDTFSSLLEKLTTRAVMNEELITSDDSAPSLRMKDVLQELRELGEAGVLGTAACPGAGAWLSLINIRLAEGAVAAGVLNFLRKELRTDGITELAKQYEVSQGSGATKLSFNDYLFEKSFHSVFVDWNAAARERIRRSIAISE